MTSLGRWLPIADVHADCEATFGEGIFDFLERFASKVLDFQNINF